MTTEEIRAVERLSSMALRAEINAWAVTHGRRWILGGPDEWTRDELVRGVCALRRGDEL